MIFRFPFGRAAGFALLLATFLSAPAGVASPDKSFALSEPPAPNEASAPGGAKAGRLIEARASSKKSDATSDAKGADAKKSGKPVQIEKYGDWGVFVAQSGKEKTCYALASPKERSPAALKRDPAYVFISNGPSADIRGEVSVILGYAVKEDGDAKAEVGGSSVELVAKGNSAWIKNLAKQAQFIEALKNGSKLIVKAPSVKGNMTTDTYSLSGLSQALDKVQKECP